MIHLAAPAWVLLAALPVAYWLRSRAVSRPGFVVSSVLATDGLPVTGRVRLRWVQVALRWLSLSFVLTALMSPSCQAAGHVTRRKGVDVLLLVDVSQSMRARDVAPDRLGRALEVAAELVRRRPHDRFGLLLFAGDNALACPLTSDHAALLTRLAAVEPTTHAGTAIGTAILGAVKRLPNQSGGSVVVFTDGAGNAGSTSSTDAARLAAAAGVRISTVSIGRTGQAAFPTEVGLIDVPVEVDDAGLQSIATRSSGVFVRADAPQAIDRLTEGIARSEPDAEVVQTTVVASLAPWCALFGLWVLAVELGFSTFYLRSAS